MSNGIGVRKIARHSIASVRALCKTLSISQIELEELLSWPSEARFKRRIIIKPNGGERVVFVPHWRYRKLLRRINKRILGNCRVIRWPSYVFGSVPNSEADDKSLIGRDYIACAAAHSGAKSILKVDVADFFDNVERSLVEDICCRFLKYPDSVSNTLAELCCLNGKLPQGAPTSSYFANLAFWDTEEKLVARLKQKGLIYTRYVDDITISSKKHGQNFSLALRLIDEMLTKKDLSRNENKTTILRSGSKPLLVHGLRVEHSIPRMPSSEYKRIRSAVRTLENFSAEPDFRKYNAFRRMYNVCLGRVNKLSRIRKNSHRKYVHRLKLISPLPSYRDLLWCRRAAKEISLRFLITGESEKYFFRRRLFRFRERLNLLQKIYKSEASSLRNSIAHIKIRSHEST